MESLKLIPIRAYKDNYIWTITRSNNPYCVIVDPGDAEPVFAYLAEHHLQPEAICITHHHWDHSNGAQALQDRFSIPIYGPEHAVLSMVDCVVYEGSTIHFKNVQLALTVLAIPGHTLDHVAFYGENILLSGDTLFSGGCGRLFEGTPQDMLHALTRLSKLPGATQIYCGHEYTVNNLRFAQTIEPGNADIQSRLEWALKKRDSDVPTLPSTIEIENKTNPFLRCAYPDVIRAVEIYAGKKLLDKVAVFTQLRKMKDAF